MIDKFEWSRKFLPNIGDITRAARLATHNEKLRAEVEWLKTALAASESLVKITAFQMWRLRTECDELLAAAKEVEPYQGCICSPESGCLNAKRWTALRAAIAKAERK